MIIRSHKQRCGIQKFFIINGKTVLKWIDHNGPPKNNLDIILKFRQTVQKLPLNYLHRGKEEQSLLKVQRKRKEINKGERE